jgi:hypothetical protein
VNLYALASIYAPAPLLARNEPDAPVFSGSASEVGEYLAARLAKRTHTMALIAAELQVLARDGRVNDSMRLELADRTSVTIRP